MFKKKRFRLEEYRRWIASLPCTTTGLEGSTQCAHIRKGFFGMGIKPGDDLTLPLSFTEHDRQGRTGEKEFWKPFGGVDEAKHLAKLLHRLWLEDDHERDRIAHMLLERFRNENK